MSTLIIIVDAIVSGDEPYYSVDFSGADLDGVQPAQQEWKEDDKEGEVIAVVSLDESSPSIRALGNIISIGQEAKPWTGADSEILAVLRQILQEGIRIGRESAKK